MTISMGTARWTRSVNAKTQYSCSKGVVVYLVRLRRYGSVPWVTKTGWNETGPNIEKKWPKYAKRHDKLILLHENSCPYVAEPVKNIYTGHELESLASPGILTGHSAIWLSLVSSRSEYFVITAFQFFSRYRKVDRWMDRLKKQGFLLAWNLFVAAKMAGRKLVAFEGQYFK